MFRKRWRKGMKSKVFSKAWSSRNYLLTLVFTKTNEGGYAAAKRSHSFISNIVFIVCQAQNWVLRHWKWCFPLASFSCSQELRLQKLLDDQTFIGHLKSWMIMFERDQTWENHLNGMPREVALRSFSTMLDENLWSLSPGLLRCSHKVFLIDWLCAWLIDRSLVSFYKWTDSSKVGRKWIRKCRIQVHCRWFSAT